MYNRFFKRILSMVLVLAMALSFVPTTVFANTQGEEQNVTTPATVEDFVVVDQPSAETTAATEPAESAPAERSPETKAATATSGTTGSCTWTLDGTVLTISGKGYMLNYGNTGPWGRNITDVIIEEGVLSIGECAFVECRSLRTVAIPETVTRIGTHAFYCCDSLTSVIIPKAVEEIYSNTFFGCKSLHTLVLPGNILEIEDDAFSLCSGLKYIYYNGYISIWDKYFKPSFLNIGASYKVFGLLGVTVYYKTETEHIFPVNRDGVLEVEPGSSFNGVDLSAPGLTVKVTGPANVAKDGKTVEVDYVSSGTITVEVYYKNSKISTMDYSVVDGDNNLFAGGFGTEERPFLIENATQFSNIRQMPDKHYMLIADISLGNMKPIDSFSGTLDGMEHWLKDWNYTYSATGNMGLFKVNSGTIKNLTIRNSSLTHIDGSKGSINVGMVCGTNKGTIEGVVVEHCSVAGDMGTPDADCGTCTTHVGGICGENYGIIRKSGARFNSTISAYAASEADGVNINAKAGGIAGVAKDNSLFENVYSYDNNISCYAMGNTWQGGFLWLTTKGACCHANAGGIVGSCDKTTMKFVLGFNNDIVRERGGKSGEALGGCLLGYSSTSEAVVQLGYSENRDGSFCGGGSLSSNSDMRNVERLCGASGVSQLSGFDRSEWVINSANYCTDHACYGLPELAEFTALTVASQKTQYEQGEALDLSAITIQAIKYATSPSVYEVLRGYKITGYNPYVEGDSPVEQKVYVNWGSRNYSSSVPDYFTVTVAPHEHTWITEATCSRGQECGVCGYVSSETTDHTCFGVVTAPTCTDSGYTTNICSVCGYSYESDSVQPLGHELDVLRKCVRCGEQFETLREFTINVCDGETGAPISGAVVTMDGVKVFTDATGAAKYQISDNEERVLVVEATGYPKLENKNFIPGEMSSTYIYLDSNDTGIYEAWCNGDNVLLIESQINVRAPSKTATIVVKGRAKTNILKYEIVQDDMVLASATDGVFKIKNPHFLLGETVYVRMHTDGQDGHNMFQRELNIKVIGFSFDAKLDELIPHLGGASFSFDETAPSFFQGVEFPLLKEMLPDDHTFKIKTDNDKLIVTYGLEKDFLDKDTEDKTTRELYKEILKKFKEQNDPNFWPKGKKKSEFTFTVALIIEVGSDGNIKSTYGEIYIGYEFSHSWGKTFVVWIVPIYVGTKFKVGGNLTLTELGYNFEESKFLIPDAEINLYTELSVYGGIGCSLVSAGVYGTAGGEIIIGWKDLQNYFKYRIYGELGVYARVDPIFWEAIEYKLPLLSGEFYGPNGQARAKRKLLTPESYDVASRDYLETRSAWKTASTYAKRGDASGVLQTSSYTALEPRIIRSGDTVMMLFLDDDGSAGYNYQHLYYSILDSATNSWSVPQRVDDSEFADLEYDVYADDSGIYIAYSKIPEITEENREDHLALLAGVEIYTARYDGTAFVEHTNVSDNDYYDAQPQVMHNAVVWVSNNTNDTLGENSNNTLMLAQKTQTGWGAAVALHENGATVTSMDLGQLDGKTWVAVIRDGDCDLSTDDRLLQLVDMTGTVTAVSTPDYTSEGVRFETVDGNCVLQWACAGNVWQLDAAENTPVALFAEENAAINESFKYQQLGEGRGVILFAQNAMDGTSAGSSLYGVYCVDGQWGEVVAITEHAEGMYVDAFDACYYKEKILLAYINTEAQIGEETIDRTCSFISSTVELKNDLAVGEAVFLEAELFEGAEIEIRVPITNGSWQKLQNTRVQVQTENATVVYEQNVALEEAIASGESDRVVFKLPKSCLTAGQAYSVVVTAVDWTDSDLSNNSTSLDLWYADFEVVAKQIVQGEEPQIQYAVINSGNTEGSGRLVIYDDKNEDGSFTGQTPLYEQAITVGISKSVSGIIPALSDLKDNTVYVVVEPTTAEMYLFNNEHSVSVTEAKRTTTDDITGQEQAIPNPVFAEPYVIYDRYDGGEITARATENGWTFTDIAGLDSGSYSYSDSVLKLTETYLQSLEQGYHYYSVRYTLNGKTAEALLIVEVRDQAPLTVQNVTVTYDGAPVEVTDLQYETSSKGAVSFRYNDGTVWHEGLPTDAGEYTVELSLAADAEGFYSAAQKQFILTVNRAVRTVSAPQQITRTKEGIRFSGAVVDKEPTDGTISYGYSTKADPTTVTDWTEEGFIPAQDTEMTYYLFARSIGSHNYTDSYSAAYITTGVKKDPIVAVYENGALTGQYSDFGAAVETCGTNGYVKLLCDTRVDVTLTKDLYIDLNGFDLSGRLSGGKVYGMDSTTDKYTCENRGIFSCVDAVGAKVVPVTHFKSSVTGAIKRYMAIEEQSGYSFHRFYLGVTHMSIRPQVTSVGFKAVFYGDDMVVSMLHEKNAYGYSLSLAGYGTATAYKGRDSFKSGQTVTLRVDNYDVTNFGETALTGKVLLKLQDGTVIESSGVTMTLRQLLENLNNDPGQMTAEQLKVVAKMIEKFDIIKSWNLTNLTA